MNAAELGTELAKKFYKEWALDTLGLAGTVYAANKLFSKPKVKNKIFKLYKKPNQPNNNLKKLSMIVEVLNTFKDIKNAMLDNIDPDTMDQLNQLAGEIYNQMAVQGKMKIINSLLNKYHDPQKAINAMKQYLMKIKNIGQNKVNILK